MSAGVRLAHVWDGELAEGRGQRGSGPGWRLAAGIGASRSCAPGRVAEALPGRADSGERRLRRFAANAGAGGGRGRLSGPRVARPGTGKAGCARRPRRSGGGWGRCRRSGCCDCSGSAPFAAAGRSARARRPPGGAAPFPLARGPDGSSGQTVRLGAPGPAPLSPGDRGRYPFGSGTRTSQRGWTGPPSPPSLCSHRDGRGGATEPGGRAKPSPTPPGCRGAAASRRLSPLAGLAPGARCRRTDGRALDRGSRRV